MSGKESTAVPGFPGLAVAVTFKVSVNAFCLELTLVCVLSRSVLYQHQ